jgi:N4-gp56 family major capsid protein
MTTSTYPATGGFVDNTTAATFIPELWSDEVIAAYKSNLVLANLVRKISMSGKKGDTIHLPKPIRGAANAKAINTAVTVQNDTETEVQVSIDQHYEFSRLIEDITDVQAHATLRKFYTDDAGYGLAKQVDSTLFNRGTEFGTGGYVAAPTPADWVSDAVYYVDASSGLTAFAENTVVPADVFTDAGLRALIKLMDDNDVPMDGRSLTIPPSVRETILGIDRYVSSDFVAGRGVENGKIGNLYGIDVYVSSNVPVMETASQNAATAGGDIRAAILMHKECMVLAEQMNVRSQTQYKQEWLGTLYTADTLYGTKVVRGEAGFVLAVNT